MAGQQARIKIWNSEADFLAQKEPREVAIDPYLPDVLVPDGSYVFLDNTNGAYEGAQATLYCASTTTPHRLALYQLDPCDAVEGDVATFDGAHWVPMPAKTLEITADLLPTHASRHSQYGDDPISPASIGAAEARNYQLVPWQMPRAASLDELFGNSGYFSGWAIEDAGNPASADETRYANKPQMVYADSNGTHWYGAPLRPSKTPLLQVIDSLDKLPSEVCAAILDTIPPKLILRGSDGQVYDAAGNLLE